MPGIELETRFPPRPHVVLPETDCDDALKVNTSRQAPGLKQGGGGNSAPGSPASQIPGTGNFSLAGYGRFHVHVYAITFIYLADAFVQNKVRVRQIVQEANLGTGADYASNEGPVTSKT